MSNQYQPLLPSEIYHLFTRAVGAEKLFLKPENYYFFLSKLKFHTENVCSLYCYTLIPNHFHLLVRIHDEELIIKAFEVKKNKSYDPLLHSLPDFIMEKFSNFLNSYTKAFNKVNQRKGSLFIDYLKRNIVNQNSDFLAFTWYIHKNAVHHGLTNKVGDWQFDSYQSLLSNKPTSLLRNDLMAWFDNREEFIIYHQQNIQLKNDITDI
ncbi:transposase [Pedobacter alpinus]|uniref:Transposase n=1 Tax=Pedobacter alpinus TaxID=1590643 RepID=A0ABW5TW54_9SPHI